MASTERAQNQAESPVHVGAVIGGKFRVERIIGEGGVGVVVEATHIKLDEPVALKFLRPASRANPDIVRRFAREARAAVKMKGEHAARVIDVGELADGSPFIVMEYLKGGDLASTLAKRGRVDDVSEAVEYVIQACEAIAEAHSLGVVHRDIKPENLFLVERAGARHIKLLDFGISKAALTGEISNVDLDSNHTTTIMGSPFYMSPEQLRSTHDVDGRTDIWSLGAVLYELLAGHTPWEQDNLTGLVASILEDPPQPISSFRKDLPEGLAEVITRCLEKDRAKRYQSAAELAIALFPFAPKRTRKQVERASELVGLMEGRLLESTRPPPLTSQTSLVASSLLPGPPGLPRERLSTSMTAIGEDLRGPARKPATLLIVGLAAGALIAGAAFFVARSSTPPPPVQAASESGEAKPSEPAADPGTAPTAAVTATATSTGSAEATAETDHKSTSTPTRQSAPAYRPVYQPRSQPQPQPQAAQPPPTVAAPTTAASPAAEPQRTGTSMDADPWKRNPQKPRMDENPFK